MRCRTLPNVINLIVGTTPIEILGPNPRRKSFLLAPVASGGTTQDILAQVLGAGAGQLFQVPANVTNIVDMYLWGCGGNSGAAGVTLGGGGGGAGGFATTGPLAVVGGQIIHATIGAGGSTTDSTINGPGGALLAQANHGTTPALDAAGVGGTAPTGDFKFTGGNGFAATGIANKGGGGGGAAGSFAAGGAAPSDVGGVGGGAATLLTFGQGGTGGHGAGNTGPFAPGIGVGAGGGGPGTNGGVGGGGQDGQAVIVYQMPLQGQCVSLSLRQDVVAGAGTLNYYPGQTQPFCVDDAQLGDQVGMPWWIVSGVNGVPIQITEFIYVDDDE
jgi:hypothetical protein